MYYININIARMFIGSVAILLFEVLELSRELQIYEKCNWQHASANLELM